MNIRAVRERKPSFSPSAYVEPMAVVMGQVAVGEGVGIWPGAVIRGDDEAIALETGSMVKEVADGSTAEPSTGSECHKEEVQQCRKGLRN